MERGEACHGFTGRISAHLLLGEKAGMRAVHHRAAIITTNVPAMPFDYVDFDVKLTNQPQKFYHVRQP